jgi:hypothetical protein
VKTITKVATQIPGFGDFLRICGYQSPFNYSLLLPELGEIDHGRLYAKELALGIG